MNKRILVADDDPAIADAVKLILETDGYNVKTTENSRTLYTLKKNDFPDVILLDIWMSGADGRDICTYLKSREDTKNIPVILVSASRDVSQSAKRAGADDFISKPFEMNDLLDKVKKYSQRRR